MYHLISFQTRLDGAHLIKFWITKDIPQCQVVGARVVSAGLVGAGVVGAGLVGAGMVGAGVVGLSWWGVHLGYTG